jgi:hypothetical protein
MKRTAKGDLAALERLRSKYGDDADLKRELVERLAQTRFTSSATVRRLYEALCFLRAYPDDANLLAAVARSLDTFGSRPDVRRFRHSLEDSGIAGTAINYRFFWPTARWASEQWPERLSVDWDEWEGSEALPALLPLVLPYAESLGLDEAELSPREWIDTLRGDCPDARFLIERMERLPGDDFTREKAYDMLDVPLRLAPGASTPARGSDVFPVEEVVFHSEPLARHRPDLAEEIARPPVSIAEMTPADGRRLIDLARRSMVTRSRDLDGFAQADPDDARWVDCGDGLAFGLLGLRPRRRLLLESSYAALTLKNGVPIGYVLVSALYGSAAIAYNVFETFRGAEAAQVLGRVLAMARAVFGCDTFSIDPYQLGHGNAEGLASGAWWFYYKLGFRPRDPEVKRLLRGELRAMDRDPKHRSAVQTLEGLASANLYYESGNSRDDIIGEIPLGAIGLAISRWLAARYGADRELGLRECAASAGEALGIDAADLDPAGKLWWKRWSPIVAATGAANWSAADRRALGAVVSAKGSRHESDYVRLFDAHARLRAALLELA